MGFKVNKNYFSEQGLIDVKFFSFGESWEEEVVMKCGVDKNYFYYN